MSAFRQVLADLSRGETSLTEVISFVEKVPLQNFDMAKTLFEELDTACFENLIDLETKRVLTDTIENITRAKFSNFEDSTKLGAIYPKPTPAEAASPSEAAQPIEFETVLTDRLIGSTIGDRFKIESELGQGGMGKVYKATDLIAKDARDRHPFVAIKVLNDDIKQRPLAVLALQREASRQQRLAHPNIATVHYFNRVGDLVFIIMEYLEGTRLDEFLDTHARGKGGIPLAQALPMIRGMAQALSYAHEHNFIHCDFKPSNCFITRNSTIKVLDFGIARVIRDPDDITVLDGATLGAMTPAYASLEMLEQTGNPDPSDDVYALACVSYELLGGLHPFGRTPANLAELNRLKFAPIKHLTRAQNRALARALKFRREDRTKTVNEFVTELDSQHSTAIYRSAAIRAGLTIASIALVGGFGYALLIDGRNERLTSDLMSADAEVVDRALVTFKSLDDEQRVALTAKAGKSLLNRYVKAILDASLTENYSEALLRVEQARIIFPDSASVEAASRQVLRARNRRIAELGEQFEIALSEGKLLSSDGRSNLQETLKSIESIDKKSILLKDIRIESSFADELELALSKGDLNRANLLTEAGGKLFPTSNLLQRARERLEASTLALEKAKMLHGLEDFVRLELLKAPSSIDYSRIAPQLRTIRKLSPESPELNSFFQQIRLAFSKELESALDSNAISRVQLVNRRFGDVLRALSLDEEVARVSQHISKLEEEKDELTREVNALSTRSTVDPDWAEKLRAQFERLEILTSSSEEFRSLRAEAIESVATAIRGLTEKKQWESATQNARLLKSLADPESGARIDSLLAEIRTAEQSYRIAIESDRLRKIEGEQEARRRKLAEDIASRVESVREPGDVRVITRMLETYEALGGQKAEIVSLRSRLARSLVSEVQATGRNTGDWLAGLKTLKLSSSFLPGNRELQDAIKSIENIQKIEQERLRSRKSLLLKGEMEDLIASASVASSKEWVSSLRKKGEQLILLAPTEREFVSRKYSDATLKAMSMAKALASEQRYESAIELIRSAQILDQQGTTLADEVARLTSAAEKERAKRKELEGIARNEAILRNFEAFLGADDPVNAKRVLLDLEKQEGNAKATNFESRRAVLEKLFQERIERGISAEAYSSAIGLAREALTFVQNRAPFQERLQDATAGKSALEILSAIKSGQDDAVAEADKKLRIVKQTRPKIYERYRTQWIRALMSWSNEARIDRLASHPELRALMPAETVTVAVPDSPPQIGSKSSDANSRASIAKEPASFTGTWCSGDVRIEIGATTVGFTLPSGDVVTYKVVRREQSGDTLQLQWADDGGLLIESEFEGTPDNPEKIVQVRGRAANSDWTRYDRPLSRCE